MGHIKNVILGGERASPLERGLHQVYLAVFLTAFAVANGFFALRLASDSYAALWGPALYASYFEHPPLVLLNLLPAILLIALGWFLTRRAWAAYLISAVPTIGFALVNYYKIQLRGDPFLAADFRLIRTMSGILGHYHLSVTRLILAIAAGAFLMLLFAVFLMPNSFRSLRLRLGGTLVCLALIPLLYTQVYLDNATYYKTVNNDALRHEWSDVESFVSRGFWYPFIRSVPKAFPKPPEGYSAKGAEAVLAAYSDADISPEKRVTVVGVMGEAFTDLSDFPSLAEIPAVREVYAPLHALEANCVSGDLLTNIFAGGTVDSEWGFLTGYSHHSDFRDDVDSYVRYFKTQGYDAVYRHPGYGWFYNRTNINRYLGFDESVFTDNGFGELVNPASAPRRSDKVLFDYLYRELAARGADDPPLFSFSVTYQNHGPYESQSTSGIRYLTSAATGWSEESCNILNNYLNGIADTISELVRFTDELESLDRPIVLVFFGDHKPWLGNDSSVYRELEVDLGTETIEGFTNYYATPYLIWANRAAKQALNAGFTGTGETISPCFLMAELFDQCAWEGPAFMQLQRDMRAVTPLLHERELYWEDGALTDTLSPKAAEAYQRYRWAEYWRETKGLQK